MNQQDKTRAVVLDISKELGRYIEQIAVYVPHLQPETIQEIFIVAIRHLQFSYNTREAVESVMIEINTTFCPNLDKMENLLVLELATKRFVDALHEQLIIAGAYDNDDVLQYTLGGWLNPYTPYLIPTKSIQQFSQAIPLVVESQYQISRDYGKEAHYWNPALYLQPGKVPF